jgi:hypothetical protein
MAAGTARERPPGAEDQQTWSAFSWFEPSNIELVINVFDARAITGSFWVFAGSLSNLWFRLEVLDTATGFRRNYVNPAGTFASFGDIQGLIDASTANPGRTAPAVSTESPRPTESARAQAAHRSTCTPSATLVCLGEEFAAEVTWLDFAGASGSGQAFPLDDAAMPGASPNDTGAFWFFDPGVPELFVKVLDGNHINGHSWVFYGSLTNVGFTLTVTDLRTGQTKAYTNPRGTFASHGDIEAFRQ